MSIPRFTANIVLKGAAAYFSGTSLPSHSHAPISPQLRIDGSNCPGEECSTPDGTQKCCCEVGERCSSGATFCKCESASRAGFFGGGFSQLGGVFARGRF